MTMNTWNLINLYTVLSYLLILRRSHTSAELITSHELNAKFGGKTILSRTDLRLEPPPGSEGCNVRVISATDADLSSLAGRLLPSMFACEFEEGSVYYEHYGLPHQNTASVRLVVSYISRESERITQPVTLSVTVSLADEADQIVSRNTGLSVTVFNGYSEPISGANLGFTYNRGSEDCIVSVLNGAHSWPR